MNEIPDRNTAELRAHESRQDARQQSYDALLPEAENYLRDWVRFGDTIGKPKQFEKLSPFLLADMITEEPDRYGVDAEFIVNAICAGNWVTDELKASCDRIGDRAFEVWRLTDSAEDAIQDIVSWLEQCAEDADNE